jgi:hypothetical protein
VPTGAIFNISGVPAAVQPAVGRRHHKK